MAQWRKVVVSGSSAVLNQVSASGNIVPKADNGSDLGSSTLEWKDLYIDGTANLDTVDIDAGAIDGTTIGASSATTIKGTTIDATTDFTIGTTVITDDSIVMTPTSGDTATIAASTNGVLAITTVDTAAAAANITITADGTFEAIGTTVTLDSGGAINLEPAAGSAILLDGTISVDAGVVTGATSITSTAFVGTIDGVIGGNTPAAITGTTITANTGVVPDANDGAYLGQAGTAFSDLFLAEGGVINWDSGDVTLTQTANQLAVAGGYLTVAGPVTGSHFSGSAASTGSFGYLKVSGDGVFGGDITFGDANTDSVSFGADISSNLIPNTDDTYDLGSASQAWQDLFLEGDITLTDAGTVATTAGALTLTSAAAATWSTSAGALTIDGAGGLTLDSDGTDAVNLGTEAVAKTITIGNAASTKVDINALALDFDSAAATDILAASTLSAKGATGASFGDDTGTWEFDGSGAVSETGMTTISMTPSSTLTLQGGGTSNFGDDTAVWSFNGSGAVSETGMTTFSLTPSSTMDIDAGGAVTIDGTSVTIGADDSGVAISIGHSTSETTINDNLTITGDLTVNGDQTIISTTNLAVTDKFAIFGSGSTSDTDGGIIVKNSPLAGYALGYDQGTDRWALDADLVGTATNLVPDAYVGVVQVATTHGDSLAVPIYGGTTNGVGTIYVDTDDNEIWIYA